MRMLVLNKESEGLGDKMVEKTIIRILKVQKKLPQGPQQEQVGRRTGAYLLLNNKAI